MRGLVGKDCDVSEPNSDDLRAIWHQLSKRNGWTLVDDEAAFMQEVAAEWQVLVKARTPNDRNRLAIYRAYGARLYTALRRNLDQAWNELGQAFFRTAVRDVAPEAAQALAQNALEDVFANLAALKSPQSLFSYAFAIFRTVLHKHWDAQGRARRVEAASAPDAAPDAPLLEPVDPRNLFAEVEQRIASEELLALLREALANDHERYIIVRTAIEEAPPREVARELDMSPPQVRLLKCRGLKRLRENPAFMRKLRMLVGEAADRIGNDHHGE